MSNCKVTSHSACIQGSVTEAFFKAVMDIWDGGSWKTREFTVTKRNPEYGPWSGIFGRSPVIDESRLDNYSYDPPQNYEEICVEEFVCPQFSTPLILTNNSARAALAASQNAVVETFNNAHVENWDPEVRNLFGAISEFSSIEFIRAAPLASTNFLLNGVRGSVEHYFEAVSKYFTARYAQPLCERDSMDTLLRGLAPDDVVLGDHYGTDRKKYNDAMARSEIDEHALIEATTYFATRDQNLAHALMAAWYFRGGNITAAKAETDQICFPKTDLSTSRDRIIAKVLSDVNRAAAAPTGEEDKAPTGATETPPTRKPSKKTRPAEPADDSAKRAREAEKRRKAEEADKKRREAEDAAKPGKRGRPRDEGF
ncbi:MAG: hypothetical protein HY540_07945 [Deltaproteobacteria bacterium]|nr:hypothetical protein [Deltaproteobacteria bacterium]